MKKLRTILLISMILIMIGMMLLPGAIGDTEYSANILNGQNTAITATPDADFGDLSPGSSENEILSSLQLTNTGNAVGVVSATFTTNTSSGDYTAIFGMINETNVIGGANFSMNNTDGGVYVSLDNNLAPTEMTGNNVTADSVADTWSVKLDVPAGQVSASYAGTVQLTFT